MKSISRLLIALFGIVILLNCSNDDDNNTGILGQWKLAQILADPGDGSGVFTDIDSNKTIIFFEDGTFSSNGNLCFFNSLTQITTEGTFSLENEEIIPISCDSFAQIILDFKLEGGLMTVYYQCIEACAERYVKIN